MRQWRNQIKAVGLHAQGIQQRGPNLSAFVIFLILVQSGRARVVGMDVWGFGAVAGWLDARAAIGINGVDPVFCTLRGGTMKTSYVRSLLPRLARRAGVQKRVATMLTMTGAHAVLEIHADASSAIKSFGG